MKNLQKDIEQFRNGDDLIRSKVIEWFAECLPVKGFVADEENGVCIGERQSHGFPELKRVFMEGDLLMIEDDYSDTRPSAEWSTDDLLAIYEHVYEALSVKA